MQIISSFIWMKVRFFLYVYILVILGLSLGNLFRIFLAKICINYSWKWDVLIIQICINYSGKNFEIFSFAYCLSCQKFLPHTLRIYIWYKQRIMLLMELYTSINTIIDCLITNRNHSEFIRELGGKIKFDEEYESVYYRQFIILRKDTPSEILRQYFNNA